MQFPFAGNMYKIHIHSKRELIETGHFYANLFLQVTKCEKISWKRSFLQYACSLSNFKGLTLQKSEVDKIEKNQTVAEIF